MSFFGDGNFDNEDAATFGGIAGFVEESIREEASGEDDDIIEQDEENINDIDKDDLDEYVNNYTQLKLIRNSNQELFDYVVELACKHQAQWAKQRKLREEIIEERKEVWHELEALDVCEKHFKDLGDQDDDQ